MTNMNAHARDPCRASAEKENVLPNSSNRTFRAARERMITRNLSSRDEGLPLSDDPDYRDIFRMLSGGLPRHWAEKEAQRRGLDVRVLDLDPNLPLRDQVSENCRRERPSGQSLVPPGTQHPRKLLLSSEHFSLEQGKMASTGKTENDLMPLKSRSPQTSDPRAALVAMLKKRAPPTPAVGEPEAEATTIDDDVEEEEAKEPDPRATTGSSAIPDTRAALMSMLKNQAPKTPEESDPKVALTTILKIQASPTPADNEPADEEIVDEGPALKEDPTYERYFRMLKMGLPMGAVQNAMQHAGLDPSIMDLDPDKSLEYHKAVAASEAKKKKKKKSPVNEPKKPKVRRKKIYWDPIKESNIGDNSLWSITKGTINFDSLGVDQEEFESLFTDTSNPADKKKAASEKPKEAKKKKSVQVIDAKRGMNGGIILATIKVEFSVLAEMVTEMDCGKLDDTQLKALREFLPTKEEKFAIEGYIKGASSSAKTKEAAINDFCACEKYMMEMMKVDMADEKFEAMIFKSQFDNNLEELMQGVTTFINACKEVQESVRLRKLMAMILTLGNQINTGGSGRMAQGFTVDALLKLDEAKAFDKKTSVLQYLIKVVKTNEPELLRVHEEMPHLGPVENVVVETLVSELKELNGQLMRVKETAVTEGKRVRDMKSSGQKLDVAGAEPVLTAMERFAKYAEKQMKDASAQIDKVQEIFKATLAYFGEDPAKGSSDFFGTLNKFVGAFDSALQAVKRIESSELAKEKRYAKHDKEAKKKVPAKSKAPAKKESDIVAVKSKGKLDLLGQWKQCADSFTGPDAGAETTEKKDTKQADARAALMSMLNKRAPPQAEEEPKRNEHEGANDEDKTKKADPRAALMSMLSKRAPPSPAGESKSGVALEENGEAKLADPRGALMTMLNNRSALNQIDVLEVAKRKKISTKYEVSCDKENLHGRAD